MHALSGLSSDVAFEPDGSVSLRFLPEFLAKNQSPGVPSPVILIKPLTSILCPDDEDRLLCPVRALRLYRRRSNPLRAVSQRRLFISLNPDYDRDISKVTLARWLTGVIQRAYEKVGGCNELSVRAHEIRAWSASLAFAHSLPLATIMEAAFWRSQGTFIEFYLRDVSRLREDGSRGIQSLVAAQSVLTSRC